MLFATFTAGLVMDVGAVNSSSRLAIAMLTGILLGTISPADAISWERASRDWSSTGSLAKVVSD